MMEPDLHDCPNPSPASDAERKQRSRRPWFSRGNFTDHMATATWTAGEGWHDGRVSAAYGPITIMPSAAVLHYAQEIFEAPGLGGTGTRTVDLELPAEGQRQADGPQLRARLALPVE